MQRETLVENRASDLLDLDQSEIAHLQRLGRSLASDKKWWGGVDSDEPTRSTIELRHTPHGTRVVVLNAIGVIGTGRRTLVVHPKIPLEHLLYLARVGGLAPRTAAPQTLLGSTDDIWSIAAIWYTTALRHLLRRDLVKDYRTTVDDLNVVRGKVELVRTARNITSGRLRIQCEFTEFDVDTALNRILKAAISRVSGSAALQATVRHDARKLMHAFDQVTQLKPGDLRATTDRRTAHYDDALGLARIILASQDFDLRGESRHGRTVLVRTPELVESGIRNLLSNELGPAVTVTKKGLGLKPSSLTLTPDLVFGNGVAVGDVKYQLISQAWKRSHLYQATTFAAGYRTTKALVVGFGDIAPPEIQVGPIHLTVALWPVDPELTSSQAAAAIVAQTRAWLD